MQPIISLLAGSHQKLACVFALKSRLLQPGCYLCLATCGRLPVEQGIHVGHGGNSTQQAAKQKRILQGPCAHGWRGLVALPGWWWFAQNYTHNPSAKFCGSLIESARPTLIYDVVHKCMKSFNRAGTVSTLRGLVALSGKWFAQNHTHNASSKFCSSLIAEWIKLTRVQDLLL
jgi:hypothetical protein